MIPQQIFFVFLAISWILLFCPFSFIIFHFLLLHSMIVPVSHTYAFFLPSEKWFCLPDSTVNSAVINKFWGLSHQHVRRSQRSWISTPGKMVMCSAFIVSITTRLDRVAQITWCERKDQDLESEIMSSTASLTLTWVIAIIIQVYILHWSWKVLSHISPIDPLNWFLYSSL